MVLQIDNPEADQLAQELAEVTGESVEGAVTRALRDQLAKQRDIQRRLEAIRKISERFSALPILDPRTPDEIIGYDEHGLPS